MEANDGASQVFAALEESLCRDPAVEFVVAFGSRITGEETRGSDVDVAVKFSADLSDHERFEKRCFLSGDVQRDDVPFVDLSDIEALPPDVAHDAVNGTFVCGDEPGFERFRSEVEASFADRRGDLRRQQRAVIDRIAEDGLRG